MGPTGIDSSGWRAAEAIVGSVGVLFMIGGLDKHGWKSRTAFPSQTEVFHRGSYVKKLHFFGHRIRACLLVEMLAADTLALVRPNSKSQLQVQTLKR